MIEYNNGIHLKGTGLWFDSKKKAGLSFVSSANLQKFTPPEKIISTPETIKFLEKKIRKSIVLSCPYSRPFTLGSIQIELVPSGHMLGSSQIVVNKGERTLIYTGNLNLKSLPTTQKAAVRKCDVLVLKTRYGLPENVFPAFEESLKALDEFIEASFSSGATPVILTDALGIGQDIIKALGDSGYKLSLHQSIRRITKIYEDFGVHFGEYASLKSGNTDETVVIVPPDKIDSDEINIIKNKRLALITERGEEKTPPFHSELKADDVFSFSSHAGYNELLQYVEKVSPEKIYLVDRHANEFAKTLEEKGYQAIALEKPTQLNLL